MELSRRLLVFIFCINVACGVTTTAASKPISLKESVSFSTTEGLLKTSGHLGDTTITSKFLSSVSAGTSEPNSSVSDNNEHVTEPVSSDIANLFPETTSNKSEVENLASNIVEVVSSGSVPQNNNISAPAGVVKTGDTQGSRSAAGDNENKLLSGSVVANGTNLVLEDNASGHPQNTSAADDTPRYNQHENCCEYTSVSAGLLEPAKQNVTPGKEIVVVSGAVAGNSSLGRSAASSHTNIDFNKPLSASATAMTSVKINDTTGRNISHKKNVTVSETVRHVEISLTNHSSTELKSVAENFGKAEATESLFSNEGSSVKLRHANENCSGCVASPAPVNATHLFPSPEFQNGSLSAATAETRLDNDSLRYQSEASASVRLESLGSGDSDKAGRKEEGEAPETAVQHSNVSASGTACCQSCENDVGKSREKNRKSNNSALDHDKTKDHTVNIILDVRKDRNCSSGPVTNDSDLHTNVTMKRAESVQSSVETKSDGRSTVPSPLARLANSSRVKNASSGLKRRSTTAPPPRKVSVAEGSANRKRRSAGFFLAETENLKTNPLQLFLKTAESPLQKKPDISVVYMLQESVSNATDRADRSAPSSYYYSITLPAFFGILIGVVVCCVVLRAGGLCCNLFKEETHSVLVEEGVEDHDGDHKSSRRSSRRQSTV